MKKTKTETIIELRKELSNIVSLYKAKCVNWIGTTSDTDEYYTEIIANELLRELKDLDNIATVTRSNSYYIEEHSNIEIDLNMSNREEENFAKRITGIKLEGLGLIKDFQIPLKDTLLDSGLGKIDLISFNEETNTVYLIELKYEGNKETLLRATLECYTYYKIVDKKKLLNDYFNNKSFILNKLYNQIDPSGIVVKAAVLVVPGCNAFTELECLESGDRPKLKALALALDISYFTLEIYTREALQ